MQRLDIPFFSDIKLNSFRPLCMNSIGLNAIEKYGFPPFIDASCRREPDFESQFPSISSLCRQGKFAPYLRMGDIVIYMTIQGKYYPYTERHHRIVAILQVEDIYTTHQEGEAAYSNLNIKLPSNCMTVGNLPFDFDKTASNYQTEKEIKKYLLRDQQTQTKIGEQRLKLWDSNYFWKSKKWPCFIRTKALYRNLINPVPIYRQDFVSIFGKLPNTRTANKISEMQFIKLSKLIGLNISLGERIYDKNDKRE